MPDESVEGPEAEPLFTDTATVSKRSGVSEQVLWSWARDGRVPGCVRIGERTWRWHWPTFEAWFIARASKAPKASRIKVDLQRSRRDNPGR